MVIVMVGVVVMVVVCVGGAITLTRFSFVFVGLSVFLAGCLVVYFYLMFLLGGWCYGGNFFFLFFSSKTPIMFFLMGDGYFSWYLAIFPVFLVQNAELSDRTEYI